MSTFDPGEPTPARAPGGKPPMTPTFAPSTPVPAPAPSAPAPAAPAPAGSTWASPPAAQPQPSLQPPARAATDATRFLCAAVQLDGALGNRVVDAVLKEPYRAVAFSPGVDLVCVLRYALAAQARQATARGVLACVALVLVSPLFFRAPPPLPVPVFVLLLLVAAWAVVLTERLVTFYGVLRPQLSRHAFDPARAPHAEPAEEKLLGRVAAQDRQGNVSVFAGFDPFLGYGKLVSPWNFTIAVDRPDEQSDQVLPFTLAELNAEVAGVLRSLGLPGVTVAERVFVNGADLAQGLDPALRRLLLPRPDDRPRTDLPPDTLDRLREDGAGRARPYLMTTVSGWSGELVVGTVTRFSLSAARDLLFVEGGTTVLPPLHRWYHQVDHLLDRPTWRQLLTLLGTSATAVPGRLLAAPLEVLGRLAEGSAARRKKREQLRRIALGAFNYGAELSIREAAAEPGFHRYFQQVDSQMYTKVVERRVLDALTDFLADHRVDVSELRERQNVIYNGGIFTSGNANVSFVNSPVAAGAGSRIMRLAGRAPGGRKKEDR
ncbi:hypothetical protein AB0O31_06020 [Kitasatospora cineracea]|uniref:hypothetical protein n=1 Tax=Kitasatospora cineracea TaxID=88074 RepID=UPI0034446B3B